MVGCKKKMIASTPPRFATGRAVIFRLSAKWPRRPLAGDGVRYVIELLTKTYHGSR